MIVNPTPAPATRPGAPIRDAEGRIVGCSALMRQGHLVRTSGLAPHLAALLGPSRGRNP